ncbi:MAG: YgiQ family radical SAM protein [Ruminococcaceae bacterium]|nr:YgiQ family radical SAM protein [Oscillospiraceae bacterium]
MSEKSFLPISKEDMEKRGIETLDFVYVCGDAYVDHPSFGHAIISRVLESEGFSVGIIAQPDWSDTKDFMRLGKPRLGFLVSAGNIDSMVNHYSVNKKRRKEDLYSPGGKSGKRPDRATIVYCNRIREAYPGAQIIIGGIEASLRRFAHYDYWDNKVRRSLLFDSKADVLAYGMGEKVITELARAMNMGIPAKDTDIDGCCYVRKDTSFLKDFIEIPSFESVRDNKKEYAVATKLEYENQDSISAKVLVQKHSDRYLVVNPPMAPLCEAELDRVYELDYMYDYHPIYKPLGGIPAIEEVKFSITHNRGCFGECNFCALTFHQGRQVRSRSVESVVKEAERMTQMKDFKGYIHDIGGPTANFTIPSCKKQIEKGTCKGLKCLFPKPCKNMIADHSKYLQMLRKVRSLPKVKKVFIRSGIRYDYLLKDKSDTFLKELCAHHVSGQLRVAPEHISDRVLSLMGKPEAKVYDAFTEKFYKESGRLKKEQYVVPYLMSSHPGSTLEDALNLAIYTKKHKINPKQVQDFYPTPFTVSTCMYYTGINPLDMKKVYVPKGEEKQMQRALLQYNDPLNHEIVIKALKKLKREDLIGFGSDCLVRPRLLKEEKKTVRGKTSDVKTNKKTNRKENKNELSDFRRKKSVTKGKRQPERKGGTVKKRRS